MGCSAIGQRRESAAWSSSGVFSIPEWHRSGTESSFCWNLNRPKNGLFSLVAIKKALSLFPSRNTFPPLGLTLLIKNKIQKGLACQFDSLFPLSIRDFATLSFCMKCPLSKSLPKTFFIPVNVQHNLCATRYLPWFLLLTPSKYGFSHLWHYIVAICVLIFFPFWTLCLARDQVWDHVWWLFLSSTLLCCCSSSVMETWRKFQIASALGDNFWYHCDLCLCILNPFFT